MLFGWYFFLEGWLERTEWSSKRKWPTWCRVVSPSGPWYRSTKPPAFMCTALVGSICFFAPQFTANVYIISPSMLWYWLARLDQWPSVIPCRPISIMSRRRIRTTYWIQMQFPPDLSSTAFWFLWNARNNAVAQFQFLPIAVSFKLDLTLLG